MWAWWSLDKLAWRSSGTSSWIKEEHLEGVASKERFRKVPGLKTWLETDLQGGDPVSSTERCIILIFISLQVHYVKKAVISWAWKKSPSTLSLNQAPDSDEELEIDDDTKIILIDKEVAAAFCYLLVMFYVFRILGMTAMIRITHRVVMLVWRIFLPRGWILFFFYDKTNP